MIANLNGQPLQIALLDPSAGIVNRPDGSKVLVFIDPPTGIQIHIPMTDEQMNALYKQWGEKRIIVAGADQIPSNNGSG